MFKKWFGILVLVMMGSSTNVLANLGGVCTYFPGFVSCGKGTVSDVVGLGIVKINGTTITNSLSATGLTSMNSADINKVKVIGNVDVNNSILRGYFEVTGNVSLSTAKFLGQVKLIGLLTANDSQFDDLLNIVSETTTISHSILRDLHISQTDHADEKVYLQNHSVVNGDIVFDSRNGKVVESEDSEVRGRVIGGVVIKS